MKKKEKMMIAKNVFRASVAHTGEKRMKLVERKLANRRRRRGRGRCDARVRHHKTSKMKINFIYSLCDGTHLAVHSIDLQQQMVEPGNIKSIGRWKMANERKMW